MKKVFAQLKAEGYLVFIVDYDANRDWAKAKKITLVPTVLIMDKGNEVNRHTGIVSADTLRQGLVKDVEPDKDTSSTDYNFID